ncbi:MAG: lysylphosphatidylglycerol synthase transmembrane domain-containing protein [Candidatus Muiribacteriota bacterium]
MKRFGVFLRIIGIVLFIYLLSQSDLKIILNNIKSIKPVYVIICCFIMFLSIFIRALRSYIIFNKVNHTEHKISYIENFMIYMSGLFFGGATPSKVGELIKVRYFKKIGKGNAFYVVIMDRIWDVFYILLFAWLSFYFLNLIKIFYISTIAAFISFACFFIFKNKIITFIKQKIPFSEKYLKHNLKELTYLTIITLISNFLYFAWYYAVFLSMDINLPFFKMFWLQSFTLFISVLPISILGVGTREAVNIHFLAEYGFNNEYILSLGFVVMFYYIVVMITGFLIWLYFEHFIKRRPDFYEI